MIALDLVSFVSLAWLFTLLMFNTAVDPDKTLDESFQVVELPSDKKRVRFMLMCLASILPMLTSLLHIILFFAWHQ